MSIIGKSNINGSKGRPEKRISQRGKGIVPVIVAINKRDRKTVTGFKI